MLIPGSLDLDPDRLDRVLAEYRALGYARLGRIASDDALDALRARCDDLMLGRMPKDEHARFFFQHDSPTGRYEDLSYRDGWIGPSLRYRKIERLEHDPVFRAWIENAVFARVARAFIGGPVAIYRALLFAKAAEGGTVLPWHQDGGSFWGIDRPAELQIWTALDDAPEDAGCVELIPKSHLAGLATPLGGSIPANVVATREHEPIVKLPAQAGEAILIHNHVWHRSGLNRTTSPRRAFTVCLMDAETRCTRKRKAPRQFTRVF